MMLGIVAQSQNVKIIKSSSRGFQQKEERRGEKERKRERNNNGCPQSRRWWLWLDKCDKTKNRITNLRSAGLLPPLGSVLLIGWRPCSLVIGSVVISTVVVVVSIPVGGRVVVGIVVAVGAIKVVVIAVVRGVSASAGMSLMVVVVMALVQLMLLL